ncbi:transposable element Tc1 transposase [Trichonephila clavipes]|nr:transposable element Tc1 transposase [Trichonephila clavipes]
MDGNARLHRTLAVEELLESEDITRRDWPAYSPDLNPIEHVWDALGRRIAARLHHLENTHQLKQMLIEEWALLPQEMLHQLVLSMRRRTSAVEEESEDCTACFPHLNPIEQVWEALGRHLALRSYFLENIKTAETEHLHKPNIHGRAAIYKRFVTDVNGKRRLQWCHTHKTWSIDECMEAIWSNELSYIFSPTTERVQVCRTPVQVHDHDCLLPNVKHGGGSVII